MTHLTGSASITIARPIGEVFSLLADLTRMGEWSPETSEVRWLDGADGAGLGVRFVGDNKAKLGPIPLKRWTTESEITVFDPPATLEFVAAATTTWRFDLNEVDGVTTVTESFAYPPPSGFQRVMYNALGARDKQMLAGVERTLAALKHTLESS